MEVDKKADRVTILRLPKSQQAPPTYTRPQPTFVAPVRLKEEEPEEPPKPVKKKKRKKKEPEPSGMWKIRIPGEDEEEVEEESEEEDWGDEEFQIT